MRKTLLMTTGLAWLALTGAAGAVTVKLTPETALSPNYFVGQSVGSNTFSVGADKWSLVSGSAGIETGTIAQFSADPLGDTLPYMSVEGGSTEQVVFGTARTSISIYWGSIDGDQGGNNNLNTLTLGSFTLTGADLVALGWERRAQATSSHLRVTSWLRSPALPLSRLRRSPPPGNAFEFAIGTPFRSPRPGR